MNWNASQSQISDLETHNLTSQDLKIQQKYVCLDVCKPKIRAMLLACIANKS